MAMSDRGGTGGRGLHALNAKVSALALEVVLWVLSGLVLVITVARPLASDAMLGIGRGPYWGAAPSLTAHLSDSAWQRVFDETSADVWSVWPGMLVGGPFQRGEYVEATLPNQADVAVWSPMTFRQMVGVAGAELLSGLVIVAALALAILIIRDLRRGRLFTTTNLQRVYAIAAVLGAGGMLAEVGRAWGRVGVLTSPRIAGYVDVDWTVSFMPLILGLTIAGGAEILRIGMRLQRDVEGLV